MEGVAINAPSLLLVPNKCPSAPEMLENDLDIVH
jgi:hypothetical protein